MNFLEKYLKFQIVRPVNVGLLFEQIHLKRFLNEFNIDCVFDVGANEGQYVTMLREIGYKGTIISFEPIPNAVEILRNKSISDSKWIVEQAALDSVVRKMTFNIMVGSQFSSLHLPSDKEIDIFKNQNVVCEKLTIDTSTLKEMFTKYEHKLNFKRPFLKMDTRGHDLSVAQGAQDELQRFIGLQSELSIKKIYEDSSDYRTTLDFYASQGFELSALVPNNQGHFPRLIEIDCIMYNKKFID